MNWSRPSSFIDCEISKLNIYSMLTSGCVDSALLCNFYKIHLWEHIPMGGNKMHSETYFVKTAYNGKI